MGLPTDGKAFLETPYEIVQDNVTAMEGEALAIKNAQRGLPASDAPPGFSEEVVTETVTYKTH